MSSKQEVSSVFFSYFQGFGLNFSDSAFSSYMDWFHNFNYSLLLGVLIFVSVLFLFLYTGAGQYKSFKVEYQLGELFCSVLPSLVLLIQMVPSLSLLYFYGLMNVDSQLSLKVVAHQWYWSYDYSDVQGLEFDSYMKSSDSLSLGEARLLDVDSRCVVPNSLDIRFCISSADVLHAWALPSLSIKLDAMSGMLSVFNYSFPSVGVFYGQCSEICGANHSFMPIVLEVVLFDMFKSWCCFFFE